MTKKKGVSTGIASLPLAGIHSPASQQRLDGAGPLYKSPTPAICKKAEEYANKLLEIKDAKEVAEGLSVKLRREMELEKCRAVAVKLIGMTCLILLEKVEDKLKAKFDDKEIGISC